MTRKTWSYLDPDAKLGSISSPDSAEHPLNGMTRRRTELSDSTSLTTGTGWMTKASEPSGF
jgi:hypothetical protein